MKIQDCELLSPKVVKDIHFRLEEIMKIADMQQRGGVEGAPTIWAYANEISWLISPKQ